jgi:hypothetical protein
MVNKVMLTGACLLLVASVMFSGCKKGCGTCQSYGYSNGANNTYLGFTSQICANNFCTCNNGLEGDSCQIYSINKYFLPNPNWQVSDACGNSPIYTVTMQPSSSYPYTTFYISGLFNSGSQVVANIASTAGNQSTIVIQPQTLSTGTINSPCIASYQVSGGIARITMVFDYTPNSTGNEENCVITLTR